MDNAELYSNNNQQQKIIAENFFNEHGEKLRREFGGREIKVLDIGSGCGTILNEVVVGKSGLKFSKVIGVDVSEEMVKFSNKKYGSDLMSFYIMDGGKEIPEYLKNYKFDLITSFLSLQWINDFNKAFENVKNLLKQNGIFCCVFTQMSKSSIQKLIESEEKHVKQIINYDNLPNFQILNPTEVVKKHLDDNRMQILNIEEENFPFTFDDMEAVRGFVASITSNLSNLSESEITNFFEKTFSMFEVEIKNEKIVSYGRIISFIAQKQAQSHI